MQHSIFAAGGFRACRSFVHLCNFRQIAMPFYAVRTGRNPGIYHDWDSCKQQVDQYSKARYKKFSSKSEAEAFVNGSDNTSYKSNQSYGNNSNYGGSSNYGYNNSYGNNTNYGYSSSYGNSSNYVDNEDSSSSSSSDEEVVSFTTKRTYASYSGSSGYNTQTKRFKSTDSSSNGPVTVYTDGACFDNGKNGARAGIGVYWGPNHSRNVSERLEGRQTNNRAEIHAARHAIQQAKSEGIKDLKVHTDSQFLINGITKWIHGWKRNGWKLATGQPVVNREDFEELDKATKGINVQWEHVRGHQGIVGNEAADKLANEGATKTKKRK